MHTNKIPSCLIVLKNPPFFETPGGRLCPEDLENLRRWTLSVFPSQAKHLTNQGHDDLKFMARRFKTQFPKLLNQTYSQDLYEVSDGGVGWGQISLYNCQLNRCICDN